MNMYYYILFILFFIILEYKDRKDRLYNKKIKSVNEDILKRKCNPKFLSFLSSLNESDKKLLYMYVNDSNNKKDYYNNSENNIEKKEVIRKLKMFSYTACGSYITKSLFEKSFISSPISIIISYALQNSL